MLIGSLSLAIEYENIEMIELLLSYNIETCEALLFAIDEQFVEGKWSICFELIRSFVYIYLFLMLLLTAVELLLQHEDLKRNQQQQQQQQQQSSKNNIPDENSRVSQLG